MSLFHEIKASIYEKLTFIISFKLFVDLCVISLEKQSKGRLRELMRSRGQRH